MDLQTFLYNHGIAEYVLNSAEELQIWFNSTPTVDEFENLMYAFPLEEQSKLFSIRDVAQWYGQLSNKITTNMEIEVSYLGIDSSSRKRALKNHMALLVKELVGMNLFDSDMQSLITNFLNRSRGALQILLTLLVADGTLTELTLFKFQVELSPYPRWQSLGLVTPPTIQDLEQFIQ